MIKSIFSNGYEDIYTGKRAVTAGWMVITPSDTILSGHSIEDRREDRPRCRRRPQPTARRL